MNTIVNIKCNDVGKMLHSGIRGSNVGGGFNTPWGVEYYFCSEVQTRR